MSSWMPAASDLGWDAEFLRGFISGLNLWVMILAVVVFVFFIIMAFSRGGGVGWIIPLLVSAVFLVYTIVVAVDSSGLASYTGDWETWPTAQELGYTTSYLNGMLLGYALFDVAFSFGLTVTVALIPDRKTPKAILLPLLIIWVLLDVWLILTASGLADAVLLPWIRYWSS